MAYLERNEAFAMQGVNPARDPFARAGVSASRGFDTSVSLKGIAADTVIETTAGLTTIGRVERGDHVRAPDGTFREVLFILRRAMNADNTDMAGAVRIASGALGDGLPEHELCVARDHLLCLTRDLARLLFGRADVYVRAGDLVHLPGVTQMQCEASFVELVFDAHCDFSAGGIGLEGFAAGPATLSERDPVEIEALFQAEPRLRYSGAHASYVLQRTVLNARETRRVAAPDTPVARKQPACDASPQPTLPKALPAASVAQPARLPVLSLSWTSPVNGI